MSNVNDLFPSKYLKASDLKGREPVVVIREVTYEPVGQAKQMKGVVYFEKVEKGLVLNRTNANRITQIAGTGVIEEWKGVSIKLFSAQVEFQGSPTDAIRVKPPSASKNNPLRPAEALPSFDQARQTAPAMPDADPFGAANAGPAKPMLTDDDIPF